MLTRPSTGPHGGLLARRLHLRLLPWVALFLLLPPALTQVLGEKDMDHAFHLYDTQMARAMAEQVEEHFAAKRFSEGLAGMQRLREDHPTAIIKFTEAPDPLRMNSGKSDSLRFVGVDRWALSLLASAPPSALELYRQRHQAEANRSLSRALALAAQGDHAALVQLARRWPLTSAAARAWLAVGDVEYEAGRPHLALAAWGRTAQVLFPAVDLDQLAQLAAERAPTDPLWSALDRRLGVWDPASRVPTQRGLSAIHGEPFGGRAFGNEPEGWPNRLSLPPNPFHASREGRLRFFPIRVGDHLLVSTSRELFCSHAENGDLEWRSGRTPLVEQLPGWNEIESSSYSNRRFSEAVDNKERYVSPAANESTVVSTFQLPFEVEPEQHYNDLEIIQVLPERRLAAFDLETGERLWDHFPKGGWDGDSGTYAERFTIGSPPLVVGSHVLVQCVRTRGRIELNVACYHIQTGELIWKTPLITGQRELNMFGRALKEFVAPPLVHRDGRVYAQTQLGVIAALDLFSGTPYWVTSYDQVQMTSGRWQQGGRMSSVWRNVPPVLSEDLLLATPFDSPDLICLDLESGKPRWTMSNALLCQAVDSLRGKGVLNHLVGVSEGRVILGGRRVAAFEAPAGGLKMRAPGRLAWAFPPGPTKSLGAVVAQPLITGSTILVPDTRELVELDARTGRRTGILQWPNDGNLLVEEGLFFSTHARGVRGYFEWSDLLTRARDMVSAAPEQHLPRTRLGQLLVSRAESIIAHRQDARDLSEADRCLEEAETVLGPVTIEGNSTTETNLILYQLYHSRSNLARAAMNMGQAQLALRQALAIAPDEESAASTRLHLQEVLRGRDESLRATILTDMLTYSADEQVLCAVLNERPSQPLWSQRLQPLVTTPADKPSHERAMVSVAMYVHAERVRVWLAADKTENAPQAQAELYRVLQERRDEPFSIGLEERPGTRVTHTWQWARTLLQEGLQNHGWQLDPAIEEQAQQELAQAKLNPDFKELDSIPQRWPFTQAAITALDLHFEHALSNRNLTMAASFCLTPLPDGWRVQDLADETLSQMLRLCALASELGNHKFPAGLLKRLALEDPDRPMDDLDGQPSTISQLAQRWNAKVTSPRVVPTPVLNGDLTARTTTPDMATEIARVLGPSNDKPTLVLARPTQIAGYRDGPDPVWSHPVQSRARLSKEPNRSCVTGNLLHLALPGRIETLNLHSGKVLWYTPPSMDTFTSVQSSNGLVIVSADRGFSQSVMALEAHTGAELWRWSKQRMSRTPPTLGERHAILWPEGRGRALVLDLFSGRLSASFIVPRIHAAEQKAAFVRDGVLILVPLSRLGTPRDNKITAIDLSTSKQIWSINLSEPDNEREAVNLLHSKGRTWLVLVQRDGSQSESTICELFTDRGTLDPSPIARIPARGNLIGIQRQQALDLEQPLVLMADPGQRRVIAMDLEGGRRWSTPLPTGLHAIRGTQTMPPIWGQSRVALVMARTGDDPRAGNLPILVQLDSSTGRFLEHQDMDRQPRGMLARSYALPFDGGLWFCMDQRSEYYR